MSADVIASFVIPAIGVDLDAAYPRDASELRRREPCPTKHVRRTKALWQALKQDGVAMLETLLDNGLNPNLKLTDKHSKFTTPLHIAISKGDIGMTSLLLTRGANYDVRDGYGRTPLEVACKIHNFRCIELVIRAGASLQDPATRVASLGLTFYHLISMTSSTPEPALTLETTRDADTSENDQATPVPEEVVSSPEVNSSLTELKLLASIILDGGFARGWNGINCSFAYLNRVYNRDCDVFLLLLQAADDCRDEAFTQNCFGVLYRRRDANLLLKLHSYGYSSAMVPVMKSRHRHSDNSYKCRLDLLATPCPLVSICRVSIRRTLRKGHGRISEKISTITSLPNCVKNYLDFIK